MKLSNITENRYEYSSNKISSFVYNLCPKLRVGWNNYSTSGKLNKNLVLKTKYKYYIIWDYTNITIFNEASNNFKLFYMLFDDFV